MDRSIRWGTDFHTGWVLGASAVGASAKVSRYSILNLADRNLVMVVTRVTVPVVQGESSIDRYRREMQILKQAILTRFARSKSYYSIE